MTTLAIFGNLAGPDIIILLILGCWILGILAIIEVLKSKLDPITKLTWFLVIWFIPVAGLLIYYAIGRKQARST